MDTQTGETMEKAVDKMAFALAESMLAFRLAYNHAKADMCQEALDGWHRAMIRRWWRRHFAMPTPLYPQAPGCASYGTCGHCGARGGGECALWYGRYPQSGRTDG